MSSRKLAVLFSLIILLFSAACPVSTATAAEDPAVEPRVDQLLKAAGDYLKEAGAFAFHAEITVDHVLPSGQKIQYASSFDAAAKRPDKLRTKYNGDLRHSGAWYDGETYTLFNIDRNLYSSWPAPATLDGLIDKLAEKLGARVPLSSLFASDPYTLWREDVQTGIYAGRHLVDGTPCHHLVLTQEEMDAQVWIEEGTQLVLRKVVLTFKNAPQSPQFTAVLSDWDFAPRLSDLLFTFVPPAGASKIEFLQVVE